ncbi:MAG: ATP-binding cassette domain-containing protein, partial [Rickettsiales bacterium]|nr:ATP-binding cassette domain-containing protein [Rickettsiales bacterium]
MEDKFIIDANNVCKSFGDKKVLYHFNLRIKKGESFVILGPSGVGKSVCIKSMLGLIKVDSGSIRIIDEEITVMNDTQLLRHNEQCSMLFQGGALFDSMDVAENILFGLVNRQKKIDSIVTEKIARELIKAVGLNENILHSRISELSGGMQKRVALARAIATKPSIIFFDEPTTGLDPIMTEVINDLIVKCVHGIHATAVTITHDIRSAIQIADRIGMLYNGNIIWIGT